MTLEAPVNSEYHLRDERIARRGMNGKEENIDESCVKAGTGCNNNERECNRKTISKSRELKEQQGKGEGRTKKTGVDQREKDKI